MKTSIKYLSSFIIFVVFLSPSHRVLAQEMLESSLYPLIHSNLSVDETGAYFTVRGKKFYQALLGKEHGLPAMYGSPTGSANGINFDFQDTLLNGSLYYGLIPYGDSKHPLPVFFRSPAAIVKGKASVNLQELSGRYDMIGWAKTGKGTMGYRVATSDGRFLYDGTLSFKGTGPIEVDDTILEGPFVNLLSPTGATISFKTNNELKCEVLANGKSFKGVKGWNHEIEVKGLDPGKVYEYTVKYGENSQTFSFKTAPAAGARSKFTFAYASDSRSGSGGGDRDLGGANAYIMKKMMALTLQKDAAFMQFTGDMITGYRIYKDEMQLEYANWKKAIQPFAHYIPVFTGMGNHEVLMNTYYNPETNMKVDVDRFPFKTESSEALYAEEFVNPTNGPVSEDGASYDPSVSTEDWPSYKENVYYYTYDNVAMIVLNSDYWYSPSSRMLQIVSGNLHGYIMDNQLKWLEKTVENLEKDHHIDHIFVTSHTPAFPNGGHVADDMWYNGTNDYRAVVAGKRLEKGIIERRDDILEIIVNKSTKVRALLTGDEHNYCKTEVGPSTNIYPEVYLPKKIELKRTIYQINNGAAGAPYYAQEQTPWTPNTSGFTTQHALVLFHVEGKHIQMEVLNPDTLEKVDELKLQ